MLIFEITKTNTPLPQKRLTPILIAPPHTYAHFQRLLYRVQCKKTLAFAACRVRCNLDTVLLLTIKKNQSNLSVRSQAFHSLRFSPALESWSDIYMGLALSFRRRFPLLFFICLLYLSVTRLGMCTERSLLHIMSRHAPYCWLAKSLFWYSAPTQFSKGFLKNYIPHL